MITADVEFPSLLRGVSTQRWDTRAPGTLNEQLNMLCDPVTGLRRRPGFALKQRWSRVNPAQDVVSWFQELNGVSVHIVLDPATGTVSVYNEDWVLLDDATDTYLIATDPSTIKHAALAGTSWVLNTAVKPTAVYNDTRKNPASYGYYTVRIGEFDRIYNVTVEISYTIAGVTTLQTNTGSYTTPSTGAAAAVPNAIADQLKTALTTTSSGAVVPVTMYSLQNVVLIKANPAVGTTVNYVRVTTANTEVDLGTSQKMSVDLVTDLPNKLPDEANELVMSQGKTENTSVYYQYDAGNARWVEAAKYGSCTGISNTPVRLALSSVGAVYTLTIDRSDWPGASAGNSTNNTLPKWLEVGISGITSFQGRLGLMAEDTLTLSATGYPTRHFRTTIASLDTTDRISVAGGSASAATFHSAIQYNKDLLLLSNTHLAVLPSGNAAVTPGTATIVTNGRISAGNVQPFETGRTVQFVSLSDTYPMVAELTPTNDVTALYDTTLVTEHVRGYVPNAKFVVGMPGIGMSFLADSSSILVNEYMWNGAERPLNAWHKWTLPTGWLIRGMHGTNDALTVVAVTPNGKTYIMEMLPRSTEYVFLDGYVQATLSSLGVPSLDYLVDDTNGDWWAQLTDGSTVHRNAIAYPAASVPVKVGVQFVSSTVLPPYIPRNQAGANQFREGLLVSADIEVANTGEFFIDIPGYNDIPASGIEWADYNFSFVQNSSALAKVNVPIRTPVHTTSITLRTTTPVELNVIRAIYCTRLHNAFRRL